MLRQILDITKLQQTFNVPFTDNSFVFVHKSREVKNLAEKEFKQYGHTIQRLSNAIVNDQQYCVRKWFVGKGIPWRIRVDEKLGAAMTKCRLYDVDQITNAKHVDGAVLVNCRVLTTFGTINGCQ
jgi:hypothetical protein